LLHVVQVQLADDSRHADGIALCEEVFDIIQRIAIRLCSPSGPVVLFLEGRLAKLREELVEAI
jgi:hypothetical protein